MIESSLIDVCQITPSLLIGGNPDLWVLELLPIDHIFFCARDCHPIVENTKVVVTKGYLDDRVMCDNLAAEALRLGIQVAQAMTTGKVLVTCRSGINRAPLVAAIGLIIQQGISPIDAIMMIQQRRERAFSNRSFEEWLKRQNFHGLNT